MGPWLISHAGIPRERLDAMGNALAIDPARYLSFDWGYARDLALRVGRGGGFCAKWLPGEGSEGSALCAGTDDGVGLESAAEAACNRAGGGSPACRWRPAFGEAVQLRRRSMREFRNATKGWVESWGFISKSCPKLPQVTFSDLSLWNHVTRSTKRPLEVIQGPQIGCRGWI